MSRVGGKPIKIADGVNINVNGQNVAIKGKKGELKVTLPDFISAKVAEGHLELENKRKTKQSVAIWGMQRSHIQNMVVGVSEGFTKELELQGVGYRAQAQGKTLKLSLGFSHEVNYSVPEGIEIKTPKQTEIVVSGIDIQKVGQVAAEIRKYRQPEPYKGKGIRYVNEYVRRKEGKKK